MTIEMKRVKFLAAAAALLAGGCAQPHTYSCNDARVQPEVERIMNEICDRTGRCYVRVPSGGDFTVVVSDEIKSPTQSGYTERDDDVFGAIAGDETVRIRPRVVGTDAMRPILLHELGHTQGLEHDDADPVSAMHTHWNLDTEAYSPGDWKKLER